MNEIQTDQPKKVIKNFWGVYNPDDIINQIVSFNGLFEKIFGKLLKPLVYNSVVENSVHCLVHIYGFRDATKLFPSKLDKKEFDRVSETVFRIVKQDQSQNKL
jgi:hypothetical protein